MSKKKQEIECKFNGDPMLFFFVIMMGFFLTCFCWGMTEIGVTDLPNSVLDDVCKNEYGLNYGFDKYEHSEKRIVCIDSVERVEEKSFIREVKNEDSKRWEFGV